MRQVTGCHHSTPGNAQEEKKEVLLLCTYTATCLGSRSGGLKSQGQSGAHTSCSCYTYELGVTDQGANLQSSTASITNSMTQPQRKAGTRSLQAMG